MEVKKYPYENRSLQSIEGELWKPLIGFEGHYEISSLGRVKTLERTYINNLGASVPIRERLLKIYASTYKSKSDPHKNYSLAVILCLNGKRSRPYVGRLVYYTFVEEFDLADLSIMISYKDWDGRNIRPENLYRSSIGEIMQLSHDKQRYKTLLSENSKQISQFDIDGNFIATYDSIQEAARKTGFTAENISTTANGHTNLCRGFVWQFGKSKLMKKKKPVLEKGDGINAELLALLGLKKTTRPVPPIADLRLKSLEGEIWKAITGYEGYYEVSNYGRVKAINRISTVGKQYWRPEMIKKLCLKRSWRSSGPDAPPTGKITVNLNRENQKTSLTVARLVYNAFIAPIELKNVRQMVGYKDGNETNPHFENIYLR